VRTPVNGNTLCSDKRPKPWKLSGVEERVAVGSSVALDPMYSFIGWPEWMIVAFTVAPLGEKEAQEAYEALHIVAQKADFWK
jgi:hypothetical protein